MVYTSNRDGGGSVPSGHLAHPPPEGRLRRTGIFKALIYILEYLSFLLPSGFEISSNYIHFSSAQFRYLVYHVWNS